MRFPKRILVVEDEVMSQFYLTSVLEEGGVDTVECYDNGEKVLSVMKERSFDMVLMDINIKGAMDGIQLARQILDKYRLPIVFITAYSDEATVDEVLELSPYGFVTKPFGAKEVQVTLQVAYKRFLAEEADKGPSQDSNKEYVVIDENYTFSLDTSVLYYRNRPVRLNEKQNRFLEVLAKNINHTVSFEEIAANVWGGKTVSDSALRTLVYSIRKDVPDLHIRSYSKKGYYLTSL